MDLPAVVQLIESGPGEGFHRERLHLPTQVKLEIVRRIADAGVREIVVSRFAEEDEPPPKLADAATLFARLADELSEASRPPVCAARVSGPVSARRALAAGARRLVTTVPATDGWAVRYGGAPEGRQGALDRLAEIAALAGAAGAELAVTVLAAFGCPVDGPVAPAAVRALLERLTGEAVYGAPARLTLADDAGLATPPGVEALVRAVADLPAFERLAVRLSDTRGLALANALAALQAGVRALDGAIAGVGGSPVQPGAPGPVPTEDLAYLCGELDVATGVDFRMLRRAARRTLEAVARPLASRTVNVEPRESVYARVRSATDRVSSGASGGTSG